MNILTFRNKTPYIVQYFVNRGELVVAKPLGIGPDAILQVQTDGEYQIVASTIIEGNTYTSAPQAFSGAAKFLAQVKQYPSPGTYDFEMQQIASSDANQLQFEKTVLNPVTFTISRSGVELQRVVIQDGFLVKSIAISGTYSIYAVINGVTTDVSTTTNARSTITAIEDDSNTEAVRYTLIVSD